VVGFTGTTSISNNSNTAYMTHTISAPAIVKTGPFTVPMVLPRMIIAPCTFPDPGQAGANLTVTQPNSNTLEVEMGAGGCNWNIQLITSNGVNCTLVISCSNGVTMTFPYIRCPRDTKTC
jgi:hypothetical protein